MNSSNNNSITQRHEKEVQNGTRRRSCDIVVTNTWKRDFENCIIINGLPRHFLLPRMGEMLIRAR